MEEDNVGSIKQQLAKLFETSLRVTVPDEPDVEPLVADSTRFDDYQCNNAMRIWSKLKGKKDVAFKDLPSVAQAARSAGWLPDNVNMSPKTSHVGFGLVLGLEGKRLRTRCSKVERLVDLLDKAKSQSEEALVKRGRAAEWTSEELEQTAKAVGYGAVKYADLKNNRLTDYTFDYDQMLSDKGNTAVYLLYAHARICSIIRKSGKDIEELKTTGTIVLDHVDERVLGLHLLQFAETVEDACTNLLPNLLCDYLYNLSENFTKFYSNCQVNGSPEETSRLLLCEATAIVMRKCFYLLGIEPVYKI